MHRNRAAFNRRRSVPEQEPQRQPLSHLPRLLDSITQEENETNFNYNSLQAGMRFENKHGLTTQLAYTWSHNISIVSNDLNGLSDPFNPRYDRGSDTGFDRRHIFNASYVYNLPFGAHGSMLAREHHRRLDHFRHHRRRSRRASLRHLHRTQRPRPGRRNRPAEPGLQSHLSQDRCGLVLQELLRRSPGSLDGGTNQGFGTAGKDSAVGPGIFNWNLSLFKAIPLNEHGTRVELRFESFNTFNHTIFQGTDNGSHDGNFGAVTSDYGPRTLELGGKFVF